MTRATLLGLTLGCAIGVRLVMHFRIPESGKPVVVLHANGDDDFAWGDVVTVPNGKGAAA